MSRRRNTLPRLAVLLVLAVVIGCPLWLGSVPSRYLLLGPVDLADREEWFLDLRLAALRQDPAACAAVLKRPHIDASAVPDKALEKGCGWENAVRMREAGGVSLGADKISCPMAAAVAMWLLHEVQPLAREHLGKPVARVLSMGTYSCRNIIGNAGLADMRSEHATANAIDIAGFVLADGRQITLLRHWHSAGPESAFLKAAHRRACRYFRVALSPDYNAAHRDHLHLDRGPLWTCR